MSERQLARQSEPSIIRRDSFGNEKLVLFSEFKKACCPPNTTDATALAFMRAADVLNAIPEVHDIQLAVMKGKPTIIIREQFYLKNLRRKYPNAVLKEGLIGPDGKPKPMNGTPHPDDMAWCEVYDQPGGNLLGRMDCVRREWQMRADKEDSAWQRSPNHMLAVRCRCHAVKRVAPLEGAASVIEAPEIEVSLVDEAEIEAEVVSVEEGPAGSSSAASQKDVVVHEGEVVKSRTGDPAVGTEVPESPPEEPESEEQSPDTPEEPNAPESEVEEANPWTEEEKAEPGPVEAQAEAFAKALTRADLQKIIIEHLGERYGKDVAGGLAFLSGVLGKEVKGPKEIGQMNKPALEKLVVRIELDKRAEEGGE